MAMMIRLVILMAAPVLGPALRAKKQRLGEAIAGQRRHAGRLHAGLKHTGRQNISAKTRQRAQRPRAEPHSTGASAKWLQDAQALYSLARGLPRVPDKFTIHSYQFMYGTFLEPVSRAGAHVKMLEIGLGCDMTYGPGASVVLWRELLPRASVWFAEYDQKCVQSQRAAGKLDGIQTVVGDQGNAAVVSRWVKETGGQFDVVVDDGGHHNVQIMTSFEVLWPEVRPGGLYFIEDMQVGRSRPYSNINAQDKVAVSDVIQAWVEQLVAQPSDVRPASRQHQLPAGVAFVFCQREACAVGKSAGSSGALTQWPQQVQAVQKLGTSSLSASDKLSTHSYQTMYGIFLEPFGRAAVPVKVLEIVRLGCGLSSVALWKKLMPDANLWLVEQDSSCMQNSKASGKLDGVGLVAGDQVDKDTVGQWIQKTGGQFDVVVDSGGQHNAQILTSFQMLWPQVRPGGMYFLEGLQVGRSRAHSNATTQDQVAVSDVIQAWIEQLTITPGQTLAGLKHRLPPGVAFVFCQRGACAIGKK